MSHEMDDLKHNDTFKREHVSLIRDDRDTILLSAFGRQGSGKTTLLAALSLVLRAAGFGVKESTKRGGDHTLVITGMGDRGHMGRLCGVTRPHDSAMGEVVFSVTERELQAAREEATAWEGRAKKLNEACVKLDADRDAWKLVAERAGICMTCARGGATLDNGTPGCTDCLNSGWANGSPPGFVPDNGPEVMQFPREGTIRVVNDNGKRWRIQGLGWIMQPQGHVSADQAREICEMAASAFAPQRIAATEKEGSLKLRMTFFMQQFRKTFFNDCPDAPAVFTPDLIPEDSWFGIESKLLLKSLLRGNALSGDTSIARQEPKPETLTEARLACIEAWLWPDGKPVMMGAMKPFNDRVEAARKREG